MKRIYLDHAATTPVSQEVLAAMLPYFSDKAYNPSAQYSEARLVRADLQAARASIAHHFGAKPSEIIFTAGGTEANNLAVHGIMNHFKEASVVTSTVEHDSILQPVKAYKNRIASVQADGRVNVMSLKDLIDDTTVLVTIQYANNEVGTIQPIKEISETIKEIRQLRADQKNTLPLYLHIDACQAPGYLSIHANRLGVDLITINASKIYGPKQIGCLYIKSGTKLLPHISGGGQEKGMRSGTENVPSIIGFAKALDASQSNRDQESKRMANLQKSFVQQLESIKGVTINGSQKHRLVNNVHITMDGFDNETVMMQLEDMGILCAVGSACSASNEEPSHVLKAMGMSDAQAQSSLRFSMGVSTLQSDVDYVISCIRKIIA